MRRASRVLLWTGASFVVLLLLAVVALRVFDWNRLKDEISVRLSERLGRDVAVRGPLDVELGLGVIRVQADDIRVEDALVPSQPFLTLDRLRFGLEVRPLLTGNLVFDHITLTQPRLSLIRNEDGVVNWDFAGLRAGETEGLPQPGALPAIERLEIHDGRVVYRDAVLDETLRASIEQVQARLSRGGVLRAAGSAEVRSNDLRFELRADPLDEGENWRMEAQVALADARLSVAGTLAGPDLNVALSVPQPAQLDFLPLPDLAHVENVRFTTRLTRDRGHWWLDGLELAAGDRRLNGDVRIDAGREPPMIYATLYLNELELPEAEVEEREELIAPVSIPTQPLHRVNLRADLHVGRVTNTPVPVNDLTLLLEIENGRLVARPASADIARGNLEGSIELDASQPFPSASARLTLRGLNLASAVPGENGPLAGDVSGRIDLHSRGDDLEELAANLNGQLLFVMREGSISATWVEALDLDLAEWLVVAAVPGTVKTPIRCALVAFEVENGVLHARPVVLDTRDSVIMVEGEVDLVQENLALTLRALPKDASAVSVQGPIRVGGSLTQPAINVLTAPVIGRGAAALALGALVGPVAGLLPLIDPGLADDQNCRQLLGDEPTTPPAAGGKQ